MSRILRIQQPGGVFHITARTQGKAHWFTADLQPRIQQLIVEGTTSAGNYLIAHAVMSNHVHIVLAQGRRTLGFTMQAILRRIALLVKRKHEVAGHVFGAPFASKPCPNADYLRVAILYTNFNPVKAGLCTDPSEYPWTSHAVYASREAKAAGMDLTEIRKLFWASELRTDGASRTSYLAHAAWWRRRLAAQLADRPFTELPPNARFGDAYFAERFGAPRLTLLSPTADLRDRAHDLAARFAASCDVDLLRRSYGSPELIAMRNQIIATMLTDGYHPSALATYFRVSPATVSRIGSRLRWRDGKFR